jgi:peptide/nickel transport system ATP-binding protein
MRGYLEKRMPLSYVDAPAPLVAVEDLQTEFRLRHSRVRAVEGVSFSVQRGECVGLVGESGCGKSTIGLSIMNLLPHAGHITGGAVRLDGHDLVGLAEPQMRRVRGNDVAMIFQDPMSSLNPTWTVGRQIADPVRIHRGASKTEAHERALEVLRLVGMPQPEERVNQYPHQLSGGLRQRVMIAMALSCEPKLLIADEPTTALDVTIQAQILDLIDELRHRLKMAVLLITHDMGVIAARTDRVMVMYAGKIVEGASTHELFDTMQHPYSEALFESIPRLDQDRSQRLYSVPGLPPDLSAPPPGCRFAPRCRYATEECTAEEPLLAPAPSSAQGPGTGGPSPGSGAPATSSASVLGARAADGPGEHVFACYHPVAATRWERISFQRTGSRSGLADGASRAGRAQPPTVLQVDHLEKQFTVNAGGLMQRAIGTVKAVSDVSFTVRRGETFGLVGESGCGKTTLGRLVVALEKPTRGTVRFEGEEISALSELRLRRRDFQLMFQDPYSSLDPRMRVRSIVREPLRIQHIGNRRQQDDRVSEVLGEVGLSPLAGDLYPHEFSGGQRQRIGLARALAQHPKLIVADEPVSALDVSVQAQILNLMRSLQEEHNLTYVLISHDLAVVKYLADTIGVMYLGKLVELGPADQLYAHAAHPYTQGLIDAIPVPDPELAKRRRLAPTRGELPSAISPPSGCRFRTRCQFAQERCAEEEPMMRPFGPGHRAACHFPLQPPNDDNLVPSATVPA